uniref:DExD/H-box helicase 60 n=1 Tax=Callorhinchus milii TaxID=7868 RepID=A0A4W3GPQ1_CALMI
MGTSHVCWDSLESNQLKLHSLPLKAPRTSLLHDSVESEFFVIDGDSLMIEHVEDSTFRHGQNLHLFYLVERFLADLTNKGAKYVIVFFKDAESMWSNNFYLLSLRMALILHLQNNTEVPVFSDFTNCFSSKWQDFLHENYPYFIMISDQAYHLANNKDVCTYMLDVFIYHTLGNEINVVLTSGMCSDVRRVYGYHVTSKSSGVGQKKLERAYKAIVSTLSKHFMNESIGDDQKHRRNMQEEVKQDLSQLQCLLPDGSDIRRLVCVVSCSVTLKCFMNTLKTTETSQIENAKTGTSNVEKDQVLSFEEAKDLCRLYCVHVALLIHLPLTERAQKTTGFEWSKPLSHFLELVSSNTTWKTHFHHHKHCEYQRLWDTVSKLASGCDIGKAFPLQATTRNILQENDHSMLLLERCYISANCCFSNTRMMTSLARGKEFDERVHWHSSKKLSDDFDRTKSSTMEKSNDPEVRKQMLRNYQKLVRFHRLYGSTLEGNITKNIVTTEQGIVAPKKQSSNPKKKADIIAEENIKKKQEKEDLKLRDQWNLISRNITKEIFENFDYGVKKLDEFLKKCSGDTVKLIAEMDVLDSCFILWVDHCQTTETAKRNNKMAVEVLKRIQNIMDKYEKMLEKNQLKQISAYLKELGLNNLAQTIPDFDQATKKNSCEVGVESARFQLTYMGPYLIREERSDPDPRITHFIPDTWQRELLDAVDNNESAVIVAPTSSGKTYASYYCMEKVLKDSDDGVLVYVAPTKALVNQVIATVYNRFNKALPDGMVVCGVFTRDYRQDALNSQILITVPQCLEILMLAPQRQAWVKKIRYVIFDEVHCLGGEIGAEVWEHLLVMIRCPFLALSATIGNPEDLAQWLQSVKHYWEKAEKALQNPVKFVGSKRKQMKMPKDQRSYKVRLVTYGERYNDLEKYVCDFQTDGVDFASYHPCAALTLQHIEKYGFPSDLALSPPESLRLYDTMVQIWPAWPRAQEFCPERYKLFKDKIVIKKGDVRKYEAELKREFLNWIKNGQKEQVAEVLNKLKPKKNRISDKNMVTHFPLMVDSLRKMDRLPALFFSFLIKISRQAVEMLFRLGFARVVTATGSLALGINMPCKTVVFLDDSVFLDALQYRQMSGRAGRRGLDVIGNVLFYNIPMPKVQRLLKASVPTLKGQFPINVSLVLRLMLLVAMADDKMDAQAKTLSLLQHSLLYYNQPKNQVVLKLYFLFCTQFLVQEGFLDQEGTPHGFAGLVTHLHYHEPANFVFVSFLVKGLFHKIYAPRFSEEVMETLVLILANLFGRIYLPSCSTEEGWAKFHQSKVFLDDLPQEFADAVDEYNQSIQETFGCFLLSASKQADMLEECQLPLSRITGEGTLVADMTTPGKHPTNAVSPFARLSGITNMDLFQTYHIALRTIDINSSNIPLLGLKKYDSQGRKMPLNAYALDFYKHGSLKALMNDNMLHLGDAYVILNDFRLVLNSIRTSLKELCDNKEDHVVLAFEQLNESYYQKFEKIKS